jgi:23S rRNA pseudouridine1911/1915/1917 synthase
MTEQRTQHTGQIPDEMAGQRLDQALARMFPDYSRSRLKAWLLDGSVLVDGAQWRPRDRVLGGETVVVTVSADAAVRAEPEPMGLDVVHPGAGNANGTLMNGLLAHAPQLESLPRAGIVHRLDKDTSGLLLVAKSLPAHTALVRALAERAISRQYLAICNGVLTGGGTIDAAIGRHPVDRTRMAVRDAGRPAVTHYTVIERFRAHTYVKVMLETGRTHQIRVHFAYRRHALVGDPVYGGRLALPAGASEALRDALRGFRRQALHATRLELRHPVTAEDLGFEVPPPADFDRLLQALREDIA